MKVEFLTQPLVSVGADCLIVGIHEGETNPPQALRGTPAGDLLALLLTDKELTGDLGEVVPIHGASGLSAGMLVTLGLGPRGAFEPGRAYAAGAAVSRRLAARRRGTVAVALPEAATSIDLVSALTEGLIVGTQGPGLRKREPNRHPFEQLLLVGGEQDREVYLEAVARGRVVGEAVNLARELVDTPPADKSPTRLAARARETAIASGLGIDVWDVERIRHERLGGLLGVSAGSDEPPAFVLIEYMRGGEKPVLALVGKGITFDSGGLSLKPSASMEDMKSDMTGAAVVLATMTAVARLGLPVNLRGYIPLAENMTGGKALKLGDVLTMRNGATVEVLNTDAEGRLILADALAYAAESKPWRILDLATLTGACMVALGTRYAGLFSNDEGFAAALQGACGRTGERVWRMPLGDEFKEGLKSNVADLKNVAGKWGGAITAARFLQEFVAGTPWAHLDVAGPSWNDSESVSRGDSGATGCLTRALVALIETESRESGS